MKNNFSQNLKVLRKKRKLSQAGLAIVLGVSRATVSNWEIGRRDLTVKDALTIADFFKITLDELICAKVD